MKVIFLDIDGVLNSVEYSIGMRTSEHHIRLDDADPVKIGLLRFICEQTGANIVISSSWRIGRSVEWFRGFFSAHGWPLPPIIDVTPTCACIGSIGRGDEINEWLDGRDDVEAFVIVDDNSDFYEDQPLVQTNGVYGLTLKEMMKMINILGYAPTANASLCVSLQEHVNFKQ